MDNTEKARIFGMYGKGTLFTCPISNHRDKIENIFDDDVIGEKSNVRHNISDCQLILKPISEMSGIEAVSLGIAIYQNDSLKLTKDQLQEIIDGIVKRKEHIPNCSLQTIIRIVDWLRNNCYALNDAWFSNGIAIKESEAGK